VHNQECGPVEEYYRERGVVIDFEIVGGIPETMPRMVKDISAYIEARNEAAQ